MRYAQRRDLIAANPAEKVERDPVRYSGDYDIYSREEIDAIVRAAAEQAGRRDLPHGRGERAAAR
jgi:16S rRNA U1498 N3-methylase RsmE